MSREVPLIMKQGRITPWLYLAPALIIMLVYIGYPTVNTVYNSLRTRDRDAWAGAGCIEGRSCWGVLENYHHALTSELDTTSLATAWSSFWVSSFGNNIKWILFMVTGAVGFGLLMAVMSDRVSYEALAKSVIFLPMAISFVGAGVIWKFVYNFNTGGTQIGILNAIINAFGGKPIAFLQTQPLNTFVLIVVGIWMWAGFCMVILSAALKAVSAEILEAARVDGANEWTVFWQVTIPMIMPTLTVVITTMIIIVLKLFDLVFVMTGGNFNTDVIANRMYTEMYINQHPGRGAAVAVVLFALTVPIMYINIKRFQEQEEIR